ncbi:MAG TPA: SIS domain-containing protein [Pirellulales bacterium]|jgi:D-sedoheptulose 7-phosphate isomerase|nr:SIS domain-containing protein [Pirellulales bacterium]
MTVAIPADLIEFANEQFARRNRLSREFIPLQSAALAAVCREMSIRFQAGGRLLACGFDAYVSDAQHVSVEFVHPVIVGKRALPALDLSLAPAAMLSALAGPGDIAMVFGPPGSDPRCEQLANLLRSRGTLLLQWPGSLGESPLSAATDDPFIHQELTEIMYHTLWETVHVFFEQQGRGEDVGAAAFLYPFLGDGESSPEATMADVARSICQKARDDEALRSAFVRDQATALAAAAGAIHERITAGGAILAFGNGGSATDANDFVLDCVAPPPGIKPIPAISLALEPANLTAIANDVGVELIFLRQLIANGRAGDVLLAISTSGKSKNLANTLQEARRRGLLTVALVGYDGGDIARQALADHTLIVHCDYIPRIQEVQASVYHVLCRLLSALDR